MTSPNLPSPIQVPELEDPLERVRVTPMPPLGSQNISGHHYATLGAQVAAMGAEQSYVTSMLNDLQAVTQETLLRALPRILAKFQHLQRGRLNRILQDVQQLQSQAIPGGFFTRLAQVNGQPLPDLVTRADVLRVIASAIAELPPMGG